MILVIENNGYAISVPAERELAVQDLAIRAAGYGMPGITVDGTDVIGCYLAMRDAVARALAGEGATFIEAKVSRLTGHSSDDQQTKYRPAPELQALARRDPLPFFRDELRAAGIIDRTWEQARDVEIRALVDDATEFAENAPEPDPATLTRHVYAEDGAAKVATTAARTAEPPPSAGSSSAGSSSAGSSSAGPGAGGPG